MQRSRHLFLLGFLTLEAAFLHFQALHPLSVQALYDRTGLHPAARGSVSFRVTDPATRGFIKGLFSTEARSVMGRLST